MKRFLKNLAKSFGIAVFAGFVTSTVCVAIVYLGGFEYGNKYAPDILRNVGILTLVMFWPLFLAQLITFKFDDINDDYEDPIADRVTVSKHIEIADNNGIPKVVHPAEIAELKTSDENDPDLEYFRKQMLKGLRTPEEIAEDVEENGSSWEDDGYGGAIKK